MLKALCCQKVKGNTVQSFVAAADPAKTYYIVSTGHAQVSHNGQVADQGGVKDVGKYWGRRKKIKFVLEIIEDQENNHAMQVLACHCLTIKEEIKMAYVSQEDKARLAPGIKAVLKSTT